MDVKQLGLNIKKIRKAASLTQYELAEKIGVSRNYISDIERGAKMAGAKTLVKIADALDVDISIMMDDITKSGRKNHISDLNDKLVQLPDEKYRLIVDLLENILLILDSTNEVEE